MLGVAVFNRQSFLSVLKAHAVWVHTAGVHGTRANLDNFYFEDMCTNFPGVNLEGARLGHAALTEFDLQGANLAKAHLVAANLQGANLESANLQGANLGAAYLQGANLENADMTGVLLERAHLENTNLKGVKGLYTFNKTGGPTCYAVVHGNTLMLQVDGPTFWGSLEEFASNPLYNKGYEAQIAYLKAIESAL